MLVENAVLVEVKIATKMDPFHQAQVLHYLKASHLEVGLLLNYGREAQFKRIVYESAARKPERREPDLAEAPAARPEDNER